MDAYIPISICHHEFPLSTIFLKKIVTRTVSGIVKIISDKWQPGQTAGRKSVFS